MYYTVTGNNSVVLYAGQSTTEAMSKFQTNPDSSLNQFQHKADFIQYLKFTCTPADYLNLNIEEESKEDILKEFTDELKEVSNMLANDAKELFVKGKTFLGDTFELLGKKLKS